MKEKSTVLYLRNRVRGPNAPTLVWDAELQCSVTNVSIGCWPEIEPCLFNVRQDPCEMNNLAYYYPELVQTMLYTLNKYNETAKYRDRKKRDIEETVLYQKTIDSLEKSVRRQKILQSRTEK